MAFSIPDKGEGLSSLQSVFFQEYLDIIVAGIDGTTCVNSGCGVTAQGVPDMTVAVASGIVRSNSALFNVTGANGTVTAADVTNPRLDLVVIDNTGAIAVRAGTPDMNPKPAARSANDVALAVVYVPANSVAINANQIVDLRIIGVNRIGSSSQNFAAADLLVSGGVGIGTTDLTPKRLSLDYPGVQVAAGVNQVKINSDLRLSTVSYDTIETMLSITTTPVAGYFMAPSRIGLFIDDLYTPMGTGYKNQVATGGLAGYFSYGLYVKGGGSNYFKGRVGIATENPSVALDVTGSIKENGYYVVSQADVGTAENNVPLNQHLGELAFQNPESIVLKPQASVAPANNGDMVFQLTSNTALAIKVRGSDGTIRTVTLTLA